MLELTERARTHLIALRDKACLPMPRSTDEERALVQRTGLRLIAERDTMQLRVAPDVATRVDEVLEHDGRPLLIMTEILSRALGERTLDAEATERGVMLKLS